MVSIHCPYCGWAFSLTSEEAAAALEEVERAHHKSYEIHCPKCRRANKVSVQQLRKGMARPAANVPTDEQDADKR